jgi:uncharacterized phage protein (TIGR02218 family)
MKTLSPALHTHLAGELATLATLVKITRTDGVVMGFTSFDRDLTVAGVTYKADGAFQASAIQNRNALSTDNLDLLGMLDSAGISESDLDAGIYDHARVDVYMCNWADVTQGVMQLRRGWLGEIKQISGKYQAELRGLHDLLQRPIGATYTPECRHTLGDTGCTVNLNSIRVIGSVTSMLDASRFNDATRSEADAIFNYGLLTWTSGANNGLSVEVKTFIAQQFTLWLPMGYAIAVGDTYSVYKGCDKRFATCQTTFNNTLHFGGFPHLPGVDRILNTPDARG